MPAKYKKIYLPSHPKSDSVGCIYKHIFIAEQFLGRYLEEEECVHHKDENKLNNNIDNLMVFKTNSDHSRFHITKIAITEDGKIYTSPKINIHCIKCGKQITNNTKNNLCSDCFHVKMRKVERPIKDLLINDLKTMSIVKIGKKYNVSDNTIRKWCKYYKINYKNIININ